MCSNWKRERERENHTHTHTHTYIYILLWQIAAVEGKEWAATGLVMSWCPTVARWTRGRDRPTSPTPATVARWTRGRDRPTSPTPATALKQWSLWKLLAAEQHNHRQLQGAARSRRLRHKMLSVLSEIQVIRRNPLEKISIMVAFCVRQWF